MQQAELGRHWKFNWFRSYFGSHESTSFLVDFLAGRHKFRVPSRSPANSWFLNLGFWIQFHLNNVKKSTVFKSIVTFMHNPNVSIFLHTSTLSINHHFIKRRILVSPFPFLSQIPHLWQVTSPEYPKSAAPRPSNPRPAPSSNTCCASVPWPWAKKAKAARQLPETSSWTWTSSMRVSFRFFFLALNKSMTVFFPWIFLLFFYRMTFKWKLFCVDVFLQIAATQS